MRTLIIVGDLDASAMALLRSIPEASYSDDFFWSAATFGLGAVLLAVAIGWKPKF